jgi:peptidoglycan/LPS O-acetylase OafA/YrhL
LRGYAALAVLLFHADNILLWFGWTGVQMFFVLSGFLITGILLNSLKSDNYFSAFYARRFLRIFPVYYLLLFIVMIVALVAALPTSDFWLYFFYVQNFKLGLNHFVADFPNVFNHTWSLAIEEQFYLCYPLLVWYFNEKKLPWILAGIILLSIGWKYYLSLSYPENSIVFLHTLSNIDFLAAGGIVAICFRNFAPSSVRTVLIILSGLFIGGYYLALHYILNVHFFLYPFSRAGLHGQFFFMLLLPLSCLLLAIVYQSNLLLTRWIFENQAITYLGKISYGLYLYHFPVFILMDRYVKVVPTGGLIEDPLLVIMKFVVTIVLSIASWYWLEKPLLKLKDNFKYKFN